MNEALRALVDIRNCIEFYNIDLGVDLNVIEDELKTLEIIKEAELLPLVGVIQFYNLDTYEKYCKFYEENAKEFPEDHYDIGLILTHEEFDLLRKVFL